MLPKGWKDALRQLLLFAAAYGCTSSCAVWCTQTSRMASWNATKVINLERTLHVFIEPNIQAWAVNIHWLIDLADVSYLYSQYVVTFTILLWIYVRRNDSFYFVRNMFMAAMVIALIGYTVYPTAPPRLMPEWGFTDPVAQFTHITAERGTTSAFLNLYAAVPSMHCAFACMVGIPMSRFVKRRWAKVLWLCYPLLHRVRGDVDRQPLPHRLRARRDDRGTRGADLQAVAGASQTGRLGVQPVPRTARTYADGVS